MTVSLRYEEQPLNGGAGGEAFRIIFNGTGIEPAATLARESIQNSVDAVLNGSGKVDVDFVLRELRGEERRAFEDAARLDEIAERAEQLELPAGNALSDRDGPLRLLYIQDHGTTGLAGDPTDGRSKLRKLLMEIGGSGKITEEAHSGGSYGFGNAVYGGSSRLSTIFAYSRTIDHEGRPISVLMGCSYHRGHEYQGEPTTGRGFFGHAVRIENRGIRFDPLLNDEADRLADALGMPRDAEDIGTSILILDTPIEVENLRKGIERFWWPRLQDGLLDVQLVDELGASHEPRPKKREELKPFIEAYDVALQRSPRIAGKSYRKQYNRFGELDIGIIG